MTQWSEQGSGRFSLRGRNLTYQEQGCREVVAVIFRIRNLAHIERAFGANAALEAQAAVCRILFDELGDDGLVAVRGPGAVDVVIRNPAIFEGRSAAACPVWLEMLCAKLALMPMPTSAGPVHLWLSGWWGGRAAAEAGDGPTPRLLSAVFRGAPIGEAAGWAAQYRADMAKVAACLAALQSPAPPGLAWQPVCDPERPSSILYHEGLLRTVSDNGEQRSIGDVVMAFERLGFAPLLDRHVVNTVISRLEALPTMVMAANISAQSARLDEWWRQIEARLSHNVDVASRLVIEITETTAIPDIAVAVHFASHMKRLGCRIAVDDFGAGHASIRQLLALAPDIVKIDRLFIRKAARSDSGKVVLGHLVALAGAIGATVAAEGIETAQDARIAIDAGVRWVQGFHYGAPSLGCGWAVPARGQRADADVTPGEAEAQLARSCGVAG